MGLNNSKFKIQNSKFKIKDIFRRSRSGRTRREVPCVFSPRCGNYVRFKPRLLLALPVEVG
ncbi:MAG: hypothetical protein ACYTXY_35350, partial [Nostoc sp.]